MPPRILVADDEPFILRSLAFTLRQQEFQVSTACNGQEALDHLRQGPFDLAILDIMMPRISGYDVVERLHAETGGLPCPVVFLTAKGMDGDRERALALGARAWISKPFSPMAIISLIQDLIRNPEAATGP
jgi:CheY-like chemotaxis protein